MSEAPPILVKFDGKAFFPANAPMAKRCAEFFEPNATYRIEFREDRSAASHRFYFASVNEAFKNIPEWFQKENSISTADDFRRDALIRSGYADKIDIIGDNSDAAQAVVAHIKRQGGYAIVKSKGNVHRIYVAKSQSMKAMDRRTFEESKAAVLNELSNIIGVTPTQLAANAQHDDQDQPNEIPASDRTVDRADNESPPADPRTVTAGEAPPPASPGASTLESSQPRSVTDDATQPEGTENAGGGDHMPKPKTYNEYLVYLTAWLSYVKSAERIHARIEKEKAEMWPKLDPALTLGQRNYFMKLAADAANKL